MDGLFKTTAVVTVFSLAEKFLGFLYRIYLSRTIGSEGLGLYQIALSVFALLMTLSCSGIPATVSRLITKYRSEGKKNRIDGVSTAGFLSSIVFTVPVTITVLLFPSLFGFLFADERCLPLFRLIIPVLALNSLYSVLRGIFWGNNDFLPYSVIELIEEAVMIAVGVALIFTASDPFTGAKYAIIAVGASYIVSFSLGTAFYVYRKGKIKSPRRELKPLFKSIIPVPAVRSAGSLGSSIVSVVFPLRLIAAGFGKAEATAAYGAFFGMAMPLLSAPMSIIGPFTIVLIPKIAESFYKKDETALKSDIEKALNVTVFLSSLCVPVFLCFGEEIGLLIFGSQGGGLFTSRAAILTVLLCVNGLTTSMLNSVGEELSTFFSFATSTVLMLVSIWFLPAVMGANSLVLCYVLVFGTNTAINLFLIRKKTGVKLKFGGFAFYSLIFLIPTSALGFLLKSLLIKYLGGILTAVLCSCLLVVFDGLFFIVFGLVNIKEFFSVIKNKLSERKTKNKRNGNAKIRSTSENRYAEH